MRKANTYKILSFISFVFHHEGHEIVAQYHAFGFIKVFLDGKKVASKWHLSTNSFILFNIESDLYSVQLEPNDSGNILCTCTLIKNDSELQRHHLVFNESDESAGERLFYAATVILFAVSALFATGCIYWHVSDTFYEVLYGTTFSLILLNVVWMLAKVNFEVVPVGHVAREATTIPIKPLKTATIFNKSSIRVGYAHWMFLCCIGFFVVIVAGWEINYSGKPIRVYSGTVVSQQWITTGIRLGSAFSFARVEILPDQIVKADCPDSRENDRVVVHEKTAVIFRNTIYECADM